MTFAHLIEQCRCQPARYLDIVLLNFLANRTLVLHLSPAAWSVWRKGKGIRVAMRDVHLEQRLERHGCIMIHQVQVCVSLGTAAESLTLTTKTLVLSDH